MHSNSFVFYVLFHFLIVHCHSLLNNDKLPVKLIQHPQSQIAQAGASVTFKCEYETRSSFSSITTSSSNQLNIDNNIKIKWLFNLREMIDRGNFNIEHNQLVIKSYKPRVNSGEYRCLINNTLFSPPFVILSEPATLAPAHIDNFESSSKTKILSLSVGNVAIIPCNLPSSNPTALPIFYHNNEEIISDEFSRYRIFPSGNLQIGNVQLSDSGSYRCSAKNPITNEIRISPSSIELKVYEAFDTILPEIVYVPGDTNRVKIGSNLTLECVANGAPVPLVSWEKFGGILPPKRSEQIFGNLRLINVQPEDKGTYVCRSETGPGQATFKTSMVDVFAAPVVTGDSHVTFATEEQNLELKCPIQSRPRADIVWFYQGKRIFSDRTHILRVVGDKSVLTIKNFKAVESTGIFQCFARNEYGSVQADLLVIPKIQNENHNSAASPLKQDVKTNRPEIMMGPQNTTIYEGQTVVLLCITNQSGGKTQINWLQNELIIEPTLMRRFEINQLLGNLRIVSVQKSDAGIYKCIASNEHGMSTSEAYVKVVNNGEEIVNDPKVNEVIKSSPKPRRSSPLASRPSIKQIGADKILLKWQLIDSITGLVIDSPEILNTLAYFKVEYKTARHHHHARNNRMRSEKNPPTNVWLTIDEQIDGKKREYILTDLSKFETYRFRITTFYLNGDLTNSHASLRFRLENTWIERPVTKQAELSTGFHLSKVEVQLTQIWAIASSSLGLRWKLNNLPTKVNHTQISEKLNGFYIYYRKIDDGYSKISSDGHISIDTKNIPSLPIVNYTRIKIPVNSESSLIDSYMIENLAESSVYEIKMSCYNLIGDLCLFSKPLYGITLKSSVSISSNDDSEMANINKESVIVESSKSETSNQVLFIALGTVSAILSLVLVIFVVMCVVRQRQHKRLLAQLHNTSQKMTSSSCPTLIYEDSLRQNCQQQRTNYATKLLEANIFNSNSTQDSNSTNSQSMSTTASSMTTPPQSDNTPSHVLLMNGNTVQAAMAPPPPIPQVPPPQIYGAQTNEALNKMNINLNPLNATNQENFYHTLTNLGNLPQPMGNDESNPYSEYHNTTLNLRAQLMLKQQQQQQQQQFFINTLRTLNMKNQQSAAYLAAANEMNPKSPSSSSMRRNNSVTSSKKSKKSLRRDRDNQQIDENSVQANLLPTNYYLLPQSNQPQLNPQQILNLEAALAQNPAGLFNNGTNAPGIYLLNNYVPNQVFQPVNFVNNLNGETDPLMFNNIQPAQQQPESDSVDKSGHLENNENLTIEEQEKEPLQSNH